MQMRYNKHVLVSVLIQYKPFWEICQLFLHAFLGFIEKLKKFFSRFSSFIRLTFFTKEFILYLIKQRRCIYGYFQ